jgi:hypothetical protein
MRRGGNIVNAEANIACGGAKSISRLRNIYCHGAKK